MATKLEYTCTLSPETLKVAKDELNEDPETRLMEIKHFKDRVEKTKGLRPKLDPKFLLRFLRARKFDQERAYELINNFYAMKKEDPEIFDGLKPSNVALVYKSRIAYPHTHRDRLGRQVYFIHPVRVDTTHYTYTDVFKADFLSLSKAIEEEETQVRGFTLVIDYKGFTMSHFLSMNMDFGKRIGKMWKDAFPARMKHCLLVNEPHFLDLVMKLFTPFMSKKLVDRIRPIGTDWKALHEIIDPAHLPPEYGGTLKDPPAPEKWEETLMSCDKEMEEDGKFGFVDYTIGHETSKHQQDAITHMAGTFKKLDV